jgi:hypothetical protein
VILSRIMVAGAASVALAACGQPERVAIVPPPAHLTTCAAEPQAPSLPGREMQAERDALTLAYILALRSAWGSCAAAVAGIAAWGDGLE